MKTFRMKIKLMMMMFLVLKIGQNVSQLQQLVIQRLDVEKSHKLVGNLYFCMCYNTLILFIYIFLVYITDPYETIVYRECTSMFFENECNKSSNKMFYLVVCDCDEDACNNTPSISLEIDFKVWIIIWIIFTFFMLI